MRKVASLVLILLLVIVATCQGLAINQGIDVIVPSSATLTLSASSISFTFPSIDTWTSDKYTQTSSNFNIYTHDTGDRNPGLVVTSSELLNSDGVSIPRNGFTIYVTPQNGIEASGTLDKNVRVEDIGRGRKTATAHYTLTVDASQQAGTYNGTVTFSLINL